jgi:hypothetical protein
MDLSAMIKRAVEIGNQFGFITFDQLDELAMSSTDRLEAKDIEPLWGLERARNTRDRSVRAIFLLQLLVSSRQPVLERIGSELI